MRDRIVKNLPSESFFWRCKFFYDRKAIDQNSKFQIPNSMTIFYKPKPQVRTLQSSIYANLQHLFLLISSSTASIMFHRKLFKITFFRIARSTVWITLFHRKLFKTPFFRIARSTVWITLFHRKLFKIPYFCTGFISPFLGCYIDCFRSIPFCILFFAASRCHVSFLLPYGTLIQPSPLPKPTLPSRNSTPSMTWLSFPTQSWGSRETPGLLNVCNQALSKTSIS